MKQRSSLELAALALLALSACGSREPLQPAPGASMPPASMMAASPPTTDQLLTPTEIARPERVDELLRRSEPRQDDRFDLPPADVAPGALPIPDTMDGPDR
jgi:hypothetical protein